MKVSCLFIKDAPVRIVPQAADTNSDMVEFHTGLTHGTGTPAGSTPLALPDSAGGAALGSPARQSSPQPRTSRRSAAVGCATPALMPSSRHRGGLFIPSRRVIRGLPVNYPGA